MPVIAPASVASIVLLITVARIGVYKYGTANRQYGYELHLPKYLRREFRKNHNLYKWFDLEELAEPKAEYHPGSYLSTMNYILFFLAFLSILPLGLMVFQIEYPNRLQEYIAYSLPVIVFLVIVYFLFLDNARRKALESGLLSIHSCAIMWQAVVVAHYRALENSKAFKYYTANLAIQANDLAMNIFDIHEWVHNKNEAGTEQSENHVSSINLQNE